MLDASITAKRLPSGETLLRDIAITVAPGEIVALLGPSGVGKTTTLRILLGLDRQFDGNIHRRTFRIGAVFQEPLLLPWRTVADNIRLVVPSDPAPDISALLRDIGLQDAEALYPRQISLGMARRAAVARALAVNPDLLILDEPFASLDPATAGMVADRLRNASRAGAAVIAAMHDVDRALALATRIIVLSGRPATIACRHDNPSHASRAQLIADFPFLSHDALSEPPSAA